VILRDKTLCESGGELIIKPIADYNILSHKYIKIYLQLNCSMPKHVKIKLSNSKLTATKTKNRYKVAYSSESFFTQNCCAQPPRLRQQNYKTKIKPDSQMHSRQPKCATKTAPNTLKRMCDKKGGCAQNFCLKSSSPSEKYIFSQNKTPLLNLEYRYIFFIRY